MIKSEPLLKEEILLILSKETSYNQFKGKIKVDEKFFNRNVYHFLNKQNSVYNTGVTRGAMYASSVTFYIEALQSSLILSFENLCTFLQSKNILITESEVTYFKKCKSIVSQYINDFKTSLQSKTLKYSNTINLIGSNTFYESISQNFFKNLDETTTVFKSRFFFSTSGSIQNRNLLSSLNNTQTLAGVFKSHSGLCAGFSFLWLICMINTYAKENNIDFDHKMFPQKPLNIQLKNCDIKWFYDKICKINEQIGLRNENDNINLLHREFVDKVKFLHTYSNNNFSSRKSFLIKYNNKSELIKKITDYIIANWDEKSSHVACSLMTEEHSMAFFMYKTGSYLRAYFYDPNTNGGDFGFSIRIHKSSKSLNIDREELVRVLNNNIKMDICQILSSSKCEYIYIRTFERDDLYNSKVKDDINLQINLKNEFKEMHDNPELASIFLIFLIRTNNLFLINYLLKFVPNINPNIKNIKGFSPLERAYSFGYKDTCKVLLKHRNINPNIKNIKNIPILHSFIYSNDFEGIKILLANPKCDPNITDASGDTGLILAARFGSDKFFDVLLNHPKIKPNLANLNGETPLQMAQAFGLQSWVSKLKKYA